jgi:hypothetical protein
MSRAQKGFTSERYIQEVLINVIENIAHCKKKQHSGMHFEYRSKQGL